MVITPTLPRLGAGTPLIWITHFYVRFNLVVYQHPVGEGWGYHHYHQFSKFLNRLKRKNIIFLKNRFLRSFWPIFRSLSFFGVPGANWLLGEFEPLYASMPVTQQPYHDGLPLCYDSNCNGRNLYHWARFWLHTAPEVKMTRTRIRTSDLCIEVLQTSPLCYSAIMWSWYTCILIISHYLSSPILSYLSRIMIRHSGAGMWKDLTKNSSCVSFLVVWPKI